MKKIFFALIITVASTPYAFYAKTNNNIKIRIGTSINKEESLFIQKRNKITHKAIEEILNRKLEEKEVPTIATITSGGGNRAMIATLGFMLGLKQQKLLNTITYQASLSGSSWFLASWIAKNMPLEGYSIQLSRNLISFFDLDQFSASKIINFLVDSHKLGYKPTLCDAWGRAISSLIFGEDKPPKDLSPEEEKLIKNKGYGYRYTLASLADSLNPQYHPFPLFTAIFANTSPYQWMEFSPFEAGSQYLNAFISASGIGKHFSNGKIFGKGRELPLPYLLGLFGSAYAFDLGFALTLGIEQIRQIMASYSSEDTINKFEMIFKYLLPSAIDIKDFVRNALLQTVPSMFHTPIKGIESAIKNRYRMLPPVIPSFTQQLKESPVNQDSYYTLIDAGLDFNLPFPPLIAHNRRNVDLFIVCDASSNTALTDQRNNAMLLAEEYAIRNKLPFPDVSESLKNISLENSTLLFHDEENPDAPIIVYIPNPIIFPTTKFSYKTNEFNELQEAMTKQVDKAMPIIKQAIELAREKKRQASQIIRVER